MLLNIISTRRRQRKEKLYLHLLLGEYEADAETVPDDGRYRKFLEAFVAGRWEGPFWWGQPCC